MSHSAPPPHKAALGPVERIREALKSDDPATAAAILKDFRPADQADILTNLPAEDRQHCLALFDTAELGELFSKGNSRLREELLESLPPSTLSEMVSGLDSDEAADLLQEADPGTAHSVLDRLSVDDRADVEPLLSYPEDTAGGRMQREVLSVPAKTRARNVLARLREAPTDLENLPDIYLVDNRGVLTGALPLFRLLRLEPETPVIEAADTTPLSVTPEEDQETVANLFQRYRLNSLPVTDERGRVLGQITADDVMGVLSEEATEDLYRLASMDESSDLTEPLFHSFRRRASWLTTNALAGILTATIVSLFDSSISRLPALAALMPIVANLGGMGGVQTATIIVRAMALGHMEGASYLWVTGRQALIGLLIGLFFCLTGAVIAYLFLDNLQLGLVFGASLALILLLGGILGSAIPIGLRRLGIDPALVSGGLLTTLTDAISFLLFLGLASWLLF